MDPEKLIEAVVKFPNLYDRHSATHHNKVETDKSWEAVAQEIGYPVEICKKSWVNIRNSYNRHLREIEKRQKGGVAEFTEKSYYSSYFTRTRVKSTAIYCKKRHIVRLYLPETHSWNFR